MFENWQKRSQNAQGMVEFALILPILLVLILGIFAFGHFFFVYAATVSASREAARYGSAIGPSESGIPRFQDCNAIRAAARRVASIAGTTTINISYDDGPSKPVIGNCNTALGPDDVGLGDRIIVEVVTDYVPIVPLVNIPAFPIKSQSARTILRAAPVGVAAVALPPGSPTKANTTLLITSDNPDSSWVDQAVTVTFSLTHTGAGPAPTGDITIIGSDSDTSDGSDDITCTVAISAGSCILTPDTPGAWVFTAAYMGDANHNGSTDTETHAVYYQTVLTYDAGFPAPNPSIVNEKVLVKFTLTTVPVNTGSYVPTGNIIVTDGTVNCTVAAPSGTCEFYFYTSEDKTLTASYQTDGYFAPSSTSVLQVVNVDYGSAITVTGHSPSPSTVGENVTVSFHVSVPAGATFTPSGNVIVSDTITSCVASVSAGSCQIELTTAGIRQLTARYAGDAHFEGSTSPAIAHEVKAAGVNITSSLAPTPSGTGQSVTFTFTVSPITGSAIPTGKVQLQENGVLLCEDDLDATGSGSCKVIFHTAGTKNLDVVYSGDGNFIQKTPIKINHIVVPCPTLDTSSVRFIDKGTGNEKDWKNQFIINLVNSTSSNFTIQEVKATWPSVVQIGYIHEFHVGPTGQNATEWASAPYKKGNQDLPPPNCLWAGDSVPSVFSSAAPGQVCEGLVTGATCFTWKNASTNPPETLADTSLAASTTKGLYFVLSIPAASTSGYNVSVRLNNDTCKWISADFSR